MSAPKTDPRVWLAPSPAPLRSMVQVVKHADYVALRALYAEAVRACNDATDAMLRMDVKRITRAVPPSARCELEVRAILHAVLSRPEAQDILATRKEARRG